MYRNVSSPIFDVPEFPTLRRVKPLPKRRETYKDSGDGSPATNGSQRTPVPESTNAQVNENDVPHITDYPFSLPNTLPSLPGPDATAEELLAHADALQSYYLPILDAAAANMANMAGMMGVNTLADVARVAGITNGKNIDKDDRGFGFDEDELSLAAATFGLSLRGERLGTDDESDGQGDGDYIDHLQQPGNTKKRKVPANAFTRFSGGGGDESSDFPGENEGSALTTYSPAGHLLGSDTGQDDGGGGAKNVPSSSPSGNPLSSPQSATHLLQNRVMNHHLHGRNTSRLSAVTLASLQQKETLKVRKRQLAAVLGALSVTAPAGLNGFTGHSQLGGIGTGSGAGDENTFAMALDQALSGAWTYPYSFPYPFTSSSFSSSMTSSTAGDASVSNAPATASNAPETASGNDQKPFNNKPKIRLSKRAKPRTARLFKINEDATPPSTGADMNVESDLSKAIMKTKWSTKKNNKENGVLEGEFTFVFPSASELKLPLRLLFLVFRPFCFLYVCLCG
ncbi:hypothetical protein D9757_007450 [Collybiopsis confluens]|uniref:Uncharacterized protein n=1 Tax=Collybiopsis confluens TaxID=2823264 RepID=A0A8H5HKG0_9AGAR|nr:hypothetical protein D9757_007450 [Collybiopsis confluens]